MKSMIIISACCFMLLLGRDLHAQNMQEYQRKQPQPNFFIPAKELDNKEKLPPLVYKKPTMEEKKLPQTKAEANPLKPSSQAKNEKDTTLSGLAETPEYKQKYEDYLNSLREIKETGKALDNPRLEADLAKMNSDEKIVITP